MASVWYIGSNDERTVFGYTFDLHNGWSIPENVFTSAQRLQLDGDSGFLLGQVDGPRTLGHRPADNTPDPAWPYYTALQSLYDSEAGMPFSRVKVLTGSESRPPVEFVIWLGGGARPTHMVDGDLWFKHVGGVVPADPNEPVPGDTTPPSVPTGLAATAVGGTSLTLTWNASTGTPSGYEVRRNGSSVGTPSSPSLAQSGLAPSTQYTFAVRARDSSGNWSAWSSNLVVTTTAGGAGSAADHTIWGNTTPGSGPVLLTDGAPGITLGQKFYTYGVNTGPGNLPNAKCVGGRVYLPAGHGRNSLRVMGWANVISGGGGAGAGLLDYMANAPLRDVTIDIAGDTGWVEAEWAPFAMGESQFALIAYRFPNDAATYIHCPEAKPVEGFFRALDQSKLVWAEGTVAGKLFRLDGSPTQIVESGISSYGIDIMVNES